MGGGVASLLCALCGGETGSGMGLLEGSTLLYPEALVLDTELYHLARIYAGGLDLSREALALDVVKAVGKALTTLPPGFKPLKQIEKLIKDRKAAFFENKILGWADGELLAYGSLLAEGKIVRMSGQDVKRLDTSF